VTGISRFMAGKKRSGKTMSNDSFRQRFAERLSGGKIFLKIPLINISIGLSFLFTGILYTKHQMAVTPSNGNPSRTG
jgi:hypothetical protein